MGTSDPILTVLFFSAIGPAMAALGPLPFLWARKLPNRTIGAADAMAAGLMLGVGYLLLSAGVSSGPALSTFGFSVGALYTFWSQRYSGTDRIEVANGEGLPLQQGYKVILQGTLHAAAEGVAIGVCMFVSLRFGIFTAFALAFHNIAEAMTMTAVLKKRGLELGEIAGLCVITNVPQILLAIVAFSVSSALNESFPMALGFAAGAIVFLTMTETLPASYQRAGSSRIAFLVSFAAGAVVLLEEILL